MAVNFEAISKGGAYRSYYRNSSNYYTGQNGTLGWLYHDWNSYASYNAFAIFEGCLPEQIEPTAADASLIQLTVTLAVPVSMALSVGVMSAQISEYAYTRYSQLRQSSGVVGTISAGSETGTFSLTREQASNALAYGIKVFPSTEIGAADSTTRLEIDGTKIMYTASNPAARGNVSDLSPSPYSTLVRGEAATISYRYRQEYGGYRQAYLSVIAENQDTGEVVTICRKRSVSVADGARGSFTIPAGTLGMGRWTFTICAAPTASASYYADSSDFWTTGQTFVYNVRETPSTASVDCDGRPVPALEWTATSQAAYQVRFGDYDSGARVGSTPAFTVPRIFADGSYPVSVRSAVSSGDWSAWTATDYVTVENVEPEGDFSIMAERQGANLVIAWSAFSSAAHYAVFRDGEMIAVLDPDASQYVDRYGAAGVYQVLAVTANRYYKPSNRVTAALRPAADLMSTDGGYDWIRLRRTPDAKNQPEDIRTDVTYAYYSGRHKPLAYSTGNRTRTKSFSYIFRKTDREAARSLRACEGREVIIKTTRGESIRGVLSEMNWGDARNPVVSFTVREIDGEEGSLEYPT